MGGRHFAGSQPAPERDGAGTAEYSRYDQGEAYRSLVDTRQLERVLAIVAGACAALLVLGALVFVLAGGLSSCSRGTAGRSSSTDGADTTAQGTLVAGDPAVGVGTGAGQTPGSVDPGVSGAPTASDASDASAQPPAAGYSATGSGADGMADPDAADASGSDLSLTAARLAPQLYPTLRETAYTTVTFSAVGDNLMHMPVVNEADANAGELGDGWYDFTPMYAGVADIVASHDLNFIDQETILGGDYLGFSGYPSFNSPSAIAGQVAGFGWNLVTTATNHSLDMGLEGIQNSCATWDAQPSVVETGTFASWDDRARIRTIERGGITFAFLSYTDYLNGYILYDDWGYAVAVADADAMASDVGRAHELADVVIVAMSWGEENATVPNDSQRWFAQHLANLGVDLVVGFGPHVIQPIEWFQGYGTDGAPLGKQMLCVFSLGNFLSNQPLAIENVEGCFQCAFERYGDGDVYLTDFVWTPLINHVGGGWHQVYKLKDYPEEYAWIHESLSTTGDPLGYARSLTEQIVGPSGIYIDY